MDKRQLIEEVRSDIGSAKVEHALEKLIAFLRDDPKYQQLENYSLQLQAQFKKTKKDESLGIISFENAKLSYNQVTNGMLGILDKLEKGVFMAEGKSAGKKLRLALPILVILLLLVAGIFIFKSFKSPSGPSNPLSAEENCPVFLKESVFNILVIPFQALRTKTTAPHIALRNRLARFSDDYQINTNTKLYKLINEDDPNSYPAGSREAGNIGEGCGAKLVIWGDYEDLPSNEIKTIITTRYKFLGRKEGFKFTKINTVESTNIDTVSTISSIATEGRLTEELEATIKILFGVIAHQTENDEVAIDVLQDVQTTDSATVLLWGMTLAESYLAMKNTKRAYEAYSKVLEKQPNNALALSNRGMLLYKDKKYMEAIKDFTAGLKSNPKDSVTILTARGSAYTQLRILKSAKEDLKRAKELNPDKKIIDRKLKEWDKIENRQKQKKETAENTLQREPKNVRALLSKAQSSLSLGDYRQAIRVSSDVLKLEPNNIEAHAIRIKTYSILGNKDKLREVFQQARQQKIKPEDLLKRVPNLKVYLDPKRLETKNK